jgi:hypothetical protein
MDPTNDLIKLGDGCDMTGKVKILSLGQGQEKVRNLFNDVFEDIAAWCG